MNDECRLRSVHKAKSERTRGQMGRGGTRNQESEVIVKESSGAGSRKQWSASSRTD